MDTIELFNLVASIFGIVTGIVALALSLVFFFSAKKAERNTDHAMVEIREATSSISTISMKLLNKLTGALVTPRPNDEKLSEILRVINGDGKLHTTNEPGSGLNKSQIEQLRVDNLITAYYYCTLTNLAYKTMLPHAIEEVPTFQYVANMVNQTKTDCTILQGWLTNTEDNQAKINSSPVRHLYNEVVSLQPSVQSVEEFYINKPFSVN